MLVTSQPLATADLHILDPKKPFPPQTTSRFVEAVAIANCVVEAVKWKEKYVMSSRCSFYREHWPPCRFSVRPLNFIYAVILSFATINLSFNSNNIHGSRKLGTVY
jgi:hypothetical protein